jgi:uncharacterized membrane protein
MSQLTQVSSAVRFTTILVLATAIVALPGRAGAQLNVCNRTDESINVAVGYPQKDETSGRVVWMSRGWYTAAPRSCVTPIAGSLPARTYYVRGESSTSTWGQDASFCTSRNAYEIQDRADCAASGFTSQSFARVDVGSEVSYTFNLTSRSSPSSGQSDAAREEHAAIDGIRVNWRESLMIDGTWVMQLRNGSSTPVAFTVRCYMNSGQSKSFWVPVPAEGIYEIGSLQGWQGNFVRGEYCDAYHGSERVWRATAPEYRAGR